MLTDDKLPPLPPYLYGRECGEKERVYTAKQMREYARAVEAAAYERAAQECEKRAGPIETYNRAYPHYLECAAAIRAFAAKQPEPTEAQIADAARALDAFVYGVFGESWRDDILRECVGKIHAALAAKENK